MHRRGKLCAWRNFRRLVSLEIDGTVNLGGRIDVQLAALDSRGAGNTARDVYLSCNHKQIAPDVPVDGLFAAKRSKAPADFGISVNDHFSAEYHDVASHCSFQRHVSRIPSTVSVYCAHHPHGPSRRYFVAQHVSRDLHHSAGYHEISFDRSFDPDPASRGE